MAGLMETLAAVAVSRPSRPSGAGRAHCSLNLDDLFPLGETLQSAAFRRAGGRRHLADRSRPPVSLLADTETRKSDRRSRCGPYVPLINTVRQVLDERWNHRASAVRFRDELEDHMSPEDAEDTLRAAIAWGRYAELFSYDEEAEQFSLEEIGDTACLRAFAAPLRRQRQELPAHGKDSTGIDLPDAGKVPHAVSQPI